jgi:hypothetical protein
LSICDDLATLKALCCCTVALAVDVVIGPTIRGANPRFGETALEQVDLMRESMPRPDRDPVLFEALVVMATATESAEFAEPLSSRRRRVCRGPILRLVCAFIDGRATGLEIRLAALNGERPFVILAPEEDAMALVPSPAECWYHMRLSVRPSASPDRRLLTILFE